MPESQELRPKRRPRKSSKEISETKSNEVAVPSEITLQQTDMHDLLIRSDLNEAQVQLLATSSRGVYSINEFLQYLTAHPEDRGGYNLGITNELNMYEAVGKGLGLISWWTACREKQISRDPFQVDEFLSTITAEDLPIVFFVPPHVVTFSDEGEGSITREELNWFLSHMEAGDDAARNTFFVFGLYDAFSPDDTIRLLTKYTDDTDFIYGVGAIFRAAIEATAK